ncbi:hypothetical protein BY996DRAFT_7192045 [Phakopsora pachyrhizi]|uniref:Signal recognition particle receptor subunit beta n=1 Tax=Phakopsora pachyrhizi TaxID=170000 RepID=A0AAV0B142_PHAPC|nr:hypothetical protein BY996DRAFT_7192045 [Phakopsora pachyrhizi]CAH7676914.1 hypothetical protein PPACK8108_LOCUS12023 [Phakopsora pachyrhizi]
MEVETKLSILTPTSYPNHFILIGTSLFIILCLKLLLSQNRSDGSGSVRISSDRGVRPGSILLFGGSGSGKTRLWSKLNHGSYSHQTNDQTLESVTSTTENRRMVRLPCPSGNSSPSPYKTTSSPLLGVTTDEEGEEEKKKKKKKKQQGEVLDLVDCPGHQRLRSRCLAENLSSGNCQAVVFVIDHTNGLTGRGLRETVDSLNLLIKFLRLLSIRIRSSSFGRSRVAEIKLPWLLMFVNNGGETKQDETATARARMTERSIGRIKKLITKELSRRTTSSNRPDSDLQKHDTRPIVRLETMERIECGGGEGGEEGGRSNILEIFISSISRIFERLLSVGDGYEEGPSGLWKDKDYDLGRGISLPEEEDELVRILEEDSGGVMDEPVGMDLFDGYEREMGGRVDWLNSGTGESDDSILIDWINRNLTS